MALETCWETAFQAAVLAFVGILLTIMIGAACGLLLGGFDIFFFLMRFVFFVSWKFQTAFLSLFNLRFTLDEALK